MSIVDVLLLLAVAALAGLAVRRLVKNKRQGKSACGCDCGSCTCGCGKREKGN